MTRSRIPSTPTVDPDLFKNIEDLELSCIKDSDFNELLPDLLMNDDPILPSEPFNQGNYSNVIPHLGTGYGSQNDVPQVAITIPQYEVQSFDFRASLIPLTMYGAQFHPALGWYFPAVFPDPGVQQGVQHQSFPIYSSFTNPSTEKSVSNNSRESSSSRNKRRASRQLERAPRRNAHIKGCIVKACTCKRSPRIPRPKNAFILYRSLHAKDLLEKHQGQHQEVSRVLGEQWQNESYEVKQKFHDLAKEEKKRHSELYPDYRYDSRGQTYEKFGNADCKCGAYEFNVKAAQLKTGLDEMANRSINDANAGLGKEHDDSNATDDNPSMRRSARGRQKVNYKGL